MTQINEQVLNEIAERTPTAEQFFEYAATRERNVREGISNLTTLRAQMAKEGYHPIPQDMLRMFKELEHAGLGSLRGDSFKWFTGIRDLANKVGVISKPTNPDKPKLAAVVSAEMSVSIALAPGKDVSFKIHGVLTSEDCRFIYETLLKKATE